MFMLGDCGLKEKDVPFQISDGNGLGVASGVYV